MRAISKSRLLVEDRDHENKVKTPWHWSVLDFLLRVSLTRSAGLMNALDVRLEEVELVFGHLPKGFDNVRILFVTDLHLDGTNPLPDKVLSIVGNIDYDYCILGGDYTYGRNEDRDQVYSQIEQIAELLKTKSRVFGILGNYDLYRTAELLEGHGVEMLINEGICVERKGDKLYLAGDTHGGQICLPGGFAVFCGPTAGRKTASGKWSYNGMVGYTSRGVGTSRIKVRYFCPAEIRVITLRNGH